MGTSRSDKRRGKRPRVDDGASSSSSGLHRQNAGLPGDTPTEGDISLEPFRDSEGFPPRARLQAQGWPPPDAALKAQGRPPTGEGYEEDLFLGILPPDPARFEIMPRIPPALPLPSKEIVDALLKCLREHRRLSGEDAAQGYGDAPSRRRNGQYG